jgi:hypothetical protein
MRQTGTAGKSMLLRSAALPMKESAALKGMRKESELVVEIVGVALDAFLEIDLTIREGAGSNHHDSVIGIAGLQISIAVGLGGNFISLGIKETIRTIIASAQNCIEQLAELPTLDLCGYSAIVCQVSGIAQDRGIITVIQ